MSDDRITFLNPFCIKVSTINFEDTLYQQILLQMKQIERTLSIFSVLFRLSFCRDFVYLSISLRFDISINGLGLYQCYFIFFYPVLFCFMCLYFYYIFVVLRVLKSLVVISIFQVEVKVTNLTTQNTKTSLIFYIVLSLFFCFVFVCGKNLHQRRQDHTDGF